jgi:hypothetical protein
MRNRILTERFTKRLVFAMLLQTVAFAAPVAVRHTEGLLRGFLVLSSTEGTPLAEGDLSQVSAGDRVTTRTVFRFKDGSLYDETVVFSQRGTFQTQTYHLVQKGPSFSPQLNLSFDTSSGTVKVQATDHDGKEQVITDHVDLPPDVANGLISTLLLNIQPATPLTTVSFVATTPKPMVVKLNITPQGKDPFSVGGVKLMAAHYVVKVEIGGIKGVLAELLRKTPPDIHVWIAEGDAPVVVKIEGPLFYGGPIWRIQLASPVWPRAPAAPSGK